jgi:hypothetical protein
MSNKTSRAFVLITKLISQTFYYNKFMMLKARIKCLKYKVCNILRVYSCLHEFRSLFLGFLSIRMFARAFRFDSAHFLLIMRMSVIIILIHVINAYRDKW